MILLLLYLKNIKTLLKNKFAYHILRVKDHYKNKEIILKRTLMNPRRVGYYDLAEEEENNLLNGYGDKNSFISNSDRLRPLETNWFEFAFSRRDIQRYISFVKRKYNCRKKVVNVVQTWYNQYSKQSGSQHCFHSHDTCDVANVYYVEMVDKSLRTVLKHPITGEEIVPRVREGDLLTFPGYIEHRSPKNYTTNRKTTIAFDTNFS